MAKSQQPQAPEVQAPEVRDVPEGSMIVHRTSGRPGVPVDREPVIEKFSDTCHTIDR